MLFSSRSYAIGMAHYQMAGGIKSLLLLVAGYILVVAAILGLFVYNAPAPVLPRVLMMVAMLFLIMEGIGIVVLGAVRVAGAIRMDLATNMIESHRQMPISAARALLGYLFGSTVHILALILLHAVVLGILAGLAGVNMEAFILAQIVLAAFALFIWNFAAMGALMFRQAMPIMVLIFMFGSCGSMFLRGWGLLPGFSLLAAPFLGETIFNLGIGGGAAGAGGVHFRNAYPIALAAQAVLGALFFIGACRRYRGSYLTTFNVAMGLVLVACWGVLSVVAIKLWPGLTGPFGGDLDQPTPAVQLVAALCVAALLMLVPAYGLAAWEVRHGISSGRRVLALAGMVAAAATLVFALPFSGRLWLVTLLVLGAHAVTAYASLSLCAKSTPTLAAITMVLLLGGLWITPILGESARWYFLPLNAEGTVVHDFTLISTFSPAGIWLAGWCQPALGGVGAGAPEVAASPPLWLGILFQWTVAAILWRWARWRRQPPRSARAEIKSEPAAAPMAVT